MRSSWARAGHGEHAGEDAADVDRIDVAAQFSCFGAGLEHHPQDLLDLIADRSGAEASGSAHGDQGFADAAPFTRPLGEAEHPGVESLCGLQGGQEVSLGWGSGGRGCRFPHPRVWCSRLR